MKYLYHGSTVQGLQTLEPRHRYVPADEITDGAIYATPLPSFAAAHAFPWSSDEGIILETTDGNVRITVPAGMKNHLSVPISIYRISSEGFEPTKEEATGLTWHRNTPTAVLEEVTYQNAEEAIRILGGEIVFQGKKR